MKRYSSTRQKLDKEGFRAYTTTLYPKIEVSDQDEFIYPQDGDRLDTLAFRYYNDTTLWWVIAKANGIRGKIALSTDEIIRIPGNITTILENFDRINNNGY
tara:strand:+ start:211 stop:513 length:303 start_codon:yes stop_codon:yes gene_type:complete